MSDAVASAEDRFSEALLKYLRENQADHYEERHIAKTYRNQLNAEDRAEFIRSLEKRVGKLADAKVLEIGSGSGWRSIAMARQGASVNGVELLASGVEAARLRKQRHDALSVEFSRGEAEELPFGDDEFDAVLSFQVIEHVRDIDQSLREMFRVVKPGGFAYMETGNSLFPREEHYRIFWPPLMPKPVGKLYARARGKNPIHLDHVHFIYRRSILRRMRRAGFVSARDLYADFVRERCIDYGSISSPALRRVFAATSSVHLNALFGSVIARIGIYPGLFLLGEKPAHALGDPSRETGHR